MKKIRLFLLCLCVLCASGLFIGSQSFAQEQPAAETKDLQEKAQGQPEEVTKEGKMVISIEVKGNKSISTNTIISKMKTKPGAVYQENVVSDDLKRLYLLGFFSDIKIDTEPYRDGLKVVITVEERPVIEKISFSGIVHITLKDEKLKEMLKSKEGQSLDYPTLNYDVRVLKSLYAKRGYARCAIEYKVDADPKTNRAKVVFNVVEGKPLKIKSVTFEGNKNFSGKRLQRLIKTRPAWLFNAGILKQGFIEDGATTPDGQKIEKEENVLDDDMERLKTFYQTQGFSDARASYTIKEDPAKPFIYINITVEEGKRYLVGNVTIEGNKDIPQKDILAKLKECVPGKVFSLDAIKKDIASVQSLYFDKGYITAQVQEATSLNSYTGRIDIVYYIVENEVAYVDKIKVRGNVKTKDIVIRRELRIVPGDKFDGDKLRRSKERLQNLGFFEEVSYDTQDTAVPNKKDLTVDVKESKTGAFSFGGGYSTVEQLVGFVEIEQKNFDWKNWPYFTGAGQDLRFKASFGTISQGLDLSFTEPWVFDYPVSFGFDAYKREHKRDSDVGYGYDEEVTGGDLRLGKEISEYVRANLMYRYDSIRIGSVTEDATNDLKKEVGTNIISSMEFGLSYDSRDNVFDTTKGNLFAGSVQLAGGPFSGDKDFYKFSGRASHYIPLINRSALEFRARVGIGDAYGDSHDIPIYERYFVGGANTIRGYHERKVGPIDPVSKDPLGGNSMLIGNIEYLYPLFNFLKVAAFYDIGNTWARMGDIGSGGFKSGIGLGLRIKTPIGPVMLDYGFPLNKEPGEEKKGGGRFHFNISHGF